MHFSSILSDRHSSWTRSAVVLKCRFMGSFSGGKHVRKNVSSEVGHRLIYFICDLSLRPVDIFSQIYVFFSSDSHTRNFTSGNDVTSIKCEICSHINRSFVLQNSWKTECVPSIKALVVHSCIKSVPNYVLYHCIEYLYIWMRKFHCI